MKTVSVTKLAELQKNPENIRNICVLAHVDHGKTTITDRLVANNGIISQRMAGKLRYLDSREDEQLRGITMKSSSISLLYAHEEREYLINLIDSPGHVDFSSEVSTAVRLCDGALLVVDVVEGVCPQTHAVLRQAWLENIKPVLVLNKIDRLILELKMTTQEAYRQLTQIVEQVNAITGELFTNTVLEQSSKRDEENVNSQAQLPKPDSGESHSPTPDPAKVYDWSTGIEDIDDSRLYFSPDIGNVIFASAVDGWGFSIHQFAQLYSEKLNVNSSVLKKTLWGDFYLEAKTKKVKKGAQGKGKKPLFVQLILDNIWAVYDATIINKDAEKCKRITEAINVKVLPRDSRHKDARVLLESICSQWIPIACALLSMAVLLLPSPLEISEDRVKALLSDQNRSFDDLPSKTQQLKDDFLLCNQSAEAPTIIYISKMIPIKKEFLPQNRQRVLSQEEMQLKRQLVLQKLKDKNSITESSSSQRDKNSNGEPLSTQPAEIQSQSLEQVNNFKNQEYLVKENPGDNVESESSANSEDQEFVAFARIFSGVVKKGAPLYALGAKHDPSSSFTDEELVSNPHVTKINVGELYLFMGREIELLDEVPAGNILGVGGLQDVILKSGTLSSTPSCPSFTAMYQEAMPILRVAVEPHNPADLVRFAEGLRLLEKADPCVQVHLQPNGEHLLVTAGEMHLQKCVDDLQNEFARVPVNVSPPMVSFRETIVPKPEIDMVNEEVKGQQTTHQLTERDTASSTNTRKADSGIPRDTPTDVIKRGDAISVKTADGRATLTVQALPLPETVSTLLDSSSSLIRALTRLNKTFQTDASAKSASRPTLDSRLYEKLASLKSKIVDAFAAERNKQWDGIVDRIWAFGPNRCGPNILVNNIDGYAKSRPSVWRCLDLIKPELIIHESDCSEISDSSRSNRDMLSTFSKSCLCDHDGSVISGFQMAAASGPIFEEPLHGVCFSVESWTSPNESNYLPSPCSSDNAGEKSTVDGADHFDPIRCTYGPFSGQIMVATREACRKAFQNSYQRIVAPMYSCQIQATADVLGKLYGVIGRRNGRILSEEMKEGTSVFVVNALLPVIESFGFAEEIRKRTSGLASPQLKFSCWETINMDPFWIPTTEEEYVHFGEKADSENPAYKYMNLVRKRKGLKTEEKLVEFAEKQRTLSKNK